MTKVLSIQVPGPCPLHCAFCRSPDHKAGDPTRVLHEAEKLLRASGAFGEVYLTGTGEPGLSSVFDRILEIVNRCGARAAVLGTSAHSIRKDMVRAEISLSKYTAPLAMNALKKARGLGVPTVLSLVDTGRGVEHLEELAERYEVDGVLVRALQAEGRSKATRGKTRWWKRPGAALGEFPVAAYPELSGLGTATTCLNAKGELVPVF